MKPLGSIESVKEEYSHNDEITGADKIRSADDSIIYDRAAERKLLRKLDLHVLPPLFVLLLVAFLDRINIGNARILGLEEDLSMVGNDYAIALQVFFVLYILLEIPSNIALKKIAPSTWLSGIMLIWGIITICQGLTRSFAGLVVCRVLLGAFEAGFMPGAIYIISMYYKKYELQKRVTIFFSGAITAGAISGLLAYGIAFLDGHAGYAAWRWVFIIEGILTVVVAIAAKFCLVDWPENAKFLSEEERAQVLARLAEDTGAAAKMDRIDKASTRRVFSDWKIWTASLMYMSFATTSYSVSFFAPTILRQFEWSAIRVQIMSVPMYVVAAVLSLSCAFLADHFRHRFLFTIIGTLVATAGFIVLLLQNLVPINIQYMAIYFILAGAWTSQPICLAWLSANVAGHYKRGVATAIQVGLGNVSGFIASNLFITSEAPLYRTGYGTAFALLWFGGILCTVFVTGLFFENRKRENGGRDDRLALPSHELENLGDDHPQFRFSY